MSRNQPPFDYGSNLDMSPEQMARAMKTIGRVALFIMILAALFAGSLSSFHTVQPEERAVVKRFGKVIRIDEPGLRFRLPFGIDRVQRVATERVLKQEFGFRSLEAVANQQGATRYDESRDYSDESLMLTGDLNVIDVSWVVQYRIADPEKYLFQIREPERTLRDVSESVMRRIVGNRLGSEVLTSGRVEVSTQARDEIQEIMNSYDSGIRVNTVELQDVVPPRRVQPAFNDVNVSRQERERMINEAEKRRNQQIPRAEGQALQIIAQAQGYAAERVNRAHGEVARFNAILEEYNNAPEVTRRRLYLEAIDKVLPNVGQIIVSRDDQASPLPLLNIGTTPVPVPAPAAQQEGRQ